MTRPIGPPPNPDLPRRRYLLLIARKVYPFVQLLWAEDHFEARTTAREMAIIDPAVVSVRVFRPALLDRSAAAPYAIHRLPPAAR